MGGSSSSESSDAIKKLREYQEQQRATGQQTNINGMYQNQVLHNPGYSRSYNNSEYIDPWAVQQQAAKDRGQQELARPAIQMQGIKNDCVIDRASLKCRRNATGLFELSFTFDVLSDHC